MGEGGAAGALLGLLLGLLAANSPTLRATAEEGVARGPVIAIEKARKAATAESERAGAIDGMAAGVGEGRQVPANPASGMVGGSGPAAGSAPEPHPATVTRGAPDAELAPGGLHSPPQAAGAPGAEGPSGQAAGGAATAETEALAKDKIGPRDPFRPPPQLTETAEVNPRTPLERYEIGQLKLVGVIWETEGARAMVEDSGGLGYIVSQGTLIGSSGGVVTRIEPRRVLIKELTTDFYGEKQPREIVMELPQEDRSP